MAKDRSGNEIKAGSKISIPATVETVVGEGDIVSLSVQLLNGGRFEVNSTQVDAAD